jgi:hypothetical protein
LKRLLLLAAVMSAGVFAMGTAAFAAEGPPPGADVCVQSDGSWHAHHVNGDEHAVNNYLKHHDGSFIIGEGPCPPEGGGDDGEGGDGGDNGGDGGDNGGGDVGSGGGSASTAGLPSHSGYCAVLGNSNPNTGQPYAPGTFLELVFGQNLTDPHYLGAVAAIYVQGIGITCDPPPVGFAFDGATFVNGMGEANFPNSIYPYYAKH